MFNEYVSSNLAIYLYLCLRVVARVSVKIQTYEEMYIADISMPFGQQSVALFINSENLVSNKMQHHDFSFELSECSIIFLSTF